MLTSIQKTIEEIYKIQSPFLVEDFLLDEAERTRYLKKIPWLDSSEETLLIRQNGKNVEIGLLFDPTLLHWSKNLNWEKVRKLNSPHLLNRIGSLIEGVSHFVYFLWKMNQDQPITQLELELQAEIDKFLIFASQVHPKNLIYLIHSLYENVHWISSLSFEEKNRYQTSAKLALKYCHYLRKSYFHSAQSHAIHLEIRSFYRMSQTEKIRWIENKSS